MPIVAVNLSSSVFAEVMRLVQRGDYTCPEQFLEIAAFNQLAMERGSGSSTIGDRAPRRDPARGGAAPMETPRGGADTSRPAPVAKRTPPSAGIDEKELPAALGRLTRGDLISVRFTDAGVRPHGERVWGQVNRLFPMKLACRWIVAATARSGAWGSLDGVSEQLGADAATVGSALEVIDLAAGRKRDDLLSTGLPRRGNLSSRDRFLTQFIARTNRANEIYPGALCQFALAAFDGDRIVLTDRGHGFAHLDNPVLDGPLSNATTTLSDEEREFLLEQVARYMPGEARDLALVLDAITNDNVTPDTLLASVRPALPEDWTQLMARTHVSGLVARACELGLLRRRWEGRNVKYTTTTEAQAFLALAKAASATGAAT